MASSPVPALVDQSGLLAGRQVVAIATGASHALARCDDGLIAAWGANGSGRLGDGSTSDSRVPVAVDAAGVLSGKLPRHLVCRSALSLALTRDGVLTAWGAAVDVETPGFTSVSRRRPFEVVTSHLPQGWRICGVGGGSSASHTLALGAVPYVPRIRVVHSDLRVRLDGDATLDFGAVADGDPVVRSLVVHNDGIEPLAINGLTLDGPDASDFSHGPAPAAPIPPGSSAPLALAFARGDGFHRSAVLRIASNDPDHPVTVIDLCATVAGEVAVTLGDPAVPALSAKAITAAGSTLVPVLSAAPPVGATFTLVETTGAEFITGSFENLAQGQVIALHHAGVPYRFVVNYHGGSGNDLVLQWAVTRLTGWGENSANQITPGSTGAVTEPAAIPATGPLAGKTILSATSGFGFSIVLCSDGSIVGWGRNNAGQLGSGSTASNSPPVEVNRTGALAGRRVVSLSAGYEHCLALCADGTMVAWGAGYGSQPAVVPPGPEIPGGRVVAVAAGTDHNLALSPDGGVFQWQAAAFAQPAGVHRLRTLHRRAVDSISAGSRFSLALCSDGSLVSWGGNQWGKLGIGSWDDPPPDEPLPVDTSGVLAGRTVKAFSAGYGHAIVLLDDGTLATWGSNGYGELGDGSSGSSFNRHSPVAVDQGGILAGRTPVSVAAAHQGCVADLADGGIAAWGVGPLGRADFQHSSVPAEVFTRSLASGERMLAPRPGHYSTHRVAMVAIPHRPRLAVAHDSGIRVANGRFVADLGSAPPGGQRETTFTLRNDGIEPLAIAGVALTGHHAQDFSVVAAPPASLAPGDSAPLVVRFTAAGGFGREARLEISSDDPEQAEFRIVLAAATGGTLDAAFPQASAVPLTAAAFTASGSEVSLSLGHPPETGAELMLVEITGMEFITGRFDNLAQGEEVVLPFGGQDFRFVANYYGGSGNDLVLEWAAARPFCWGSNAAGQLGDGTFATRFLPAAASQGALAGRHPVAVAARASHTLVLCADGGLAAWGNNSAAQFGRGNSTSSPLPVAAGTVGFLAEKSVAAIATGTHHGLALCTDGTLAAWGGGSSGQLGNGTNSFSSPPVAVDMSGVLAGRRVVAIAAGYSHNLALCSDGALAAWGGNISGSLGDMTTTSRSLPVEVTATGVLAGKRVVAIAAGSYHSLALCEDGSIAAWGRNSSGELGDGSLTDRAVPVAVDRSGVLAGKTVVAIAAGELFSIALCDDGTIAAWGANVDRQLGDGGTTSSPVPVLVATGDALGGSPARRIAAGRSHSLAAGRAGAIAAWGNNFNGRLGDGTNLARSRPVAVSAAGLLPGEIFLRPAVTQGHDHGVALVALPYISRIVLRHPDGQSLPATGGAVDFAAGGVGTTTARTFTLRNDGIVPLELQEIEISGPHAGEFVLTTPPPAMLEPGAEAAMTVTFTAGAGFRRSAELLVGSNDPHLPAIRVGLESAGSGVLAAHYATGGEVPLAMPSLDPAGSSVSLSLGHEPPTGASLMLLEITGPGFIGGSFDNLTPGQEVVMEYGGRGYRFVANYYGGSGNDLVLEWAAARPAAWGRNQSGQLGTGDAANRSIPADVWSGGVLAGKRVTVLAAGAAHSLALCADGTLAAWGSNSGGRLGNGSTTSSNVPVAVNQSGVLAGKRMAAIAVGSSHSLVLSADGRVFAWGVGSNGRLGNGSSASSGNPVAVNTTGVLAGKSVVAIAAGDQHSLALCSDGTIASWGGNGAGQLGGGDSRGSNAPIAVDMAGALAGKFVVAIAAGHSHSLALCADGTLVAWGGNSSGQLGIGNTTSQPLPATVDLSGALPDRPIVGLAAGFLHTLVIAADGGIAAWGGNGSGQLGGGDMVMSAVPRLIGSADWPAGFAARGISAGYRHSVASGLPGAAALWGHNGYGQLGDATLESRPLPAALAAEWWLPGDRLLRVASGPVADHSLALVAEPVTTRLEAWRMWHFQTAAETGDAANSATPAGDGVVNFMKFATGMDPWTAGAPAVTVRPEAGGLTMTYPRAKAAVQDGFIFAIESSTDMSADSWVALPVLPETIEDLGPVQRVSVVLPIDAPARFLRLRVRPPF